ncbi:MAG: MATE family efflux transporter [Candidatus Pseudobacter hemicellulosilyticus]|uniref:Multidrug-efflux transporter n=1 Tax=Candidatus Pseudobacter hemicellulosilyticus TaxID=3121375 RepID=A0AAJ5WU58_9BACT|nr:MAG: MATE family efflux transporter [Pseudobacter sp.]
MSTEQPIDTSRQSAFSIIKQALKGEHLDFTQGSIRRSVLLLAIPMILEMIMESVFAIVDIYFVGRIEGHGTQAVSTVVLTEVVLTILYSAAMALSMGATAVVARRVGEKQLDEAAHSAAQAINLALLVTVVISLAGSFFAADILRLMGGSPEVVDIGTPYTRIMFGGSIVITLLFLVNGIFRGAGNATIAMWSLWIANGCNIILCPILIHFYGLTGAAMATTIGRGIGVTYQLFHLLRGKGLLKIKIPHFRIDWRIFKSLFDLSWVAFLQFFIGSASWMFLARLMTRFHDDAVAGYGVAIRLLMFFMLPAWGLSNAAATLVGQNLGAGEPLRAERSVWKTAQFSALYMGTVTLLCQLGAERLISLLNTDPAVISIATQGLRIMSMGFIFYGIGMVVTNAFNGAGDTRTPTIINLVGFWAFQIPFAWLLATNTNLEHTGIFLAVVIAETLISIAGVILFRRGKWKLVRV